MTAFERGIRLVPLCALTLVIVPVLAGLAGIIAPAFGWLPALGGIEPTLVHWQRLADVPGLSGMLRLSLVTGLASTLLALVIVVLFLAAFLHTPVFRAVERLLSPLLAVPHAAAAIGLAFLLAPSGWASRLISPRPSGWQQPPDYLFPGDGWGLALILGLVVKEFPFLLLMSLAALPQCQARERLKAARSLGYSPITAFLKGILPGLYPLIRLPVYAVIVFASSTVDMAIILGPSRPPTLAVSVVRWLNDPDLSLRFMASAAALLQLGVTLAALVIWWLGEHLVSHLAAPWLIDGRRVQGECGFKVLGGLSITLSIVLLGAALVGLVLWSLAAFWPFPQAWPSPMTLRTWEQALGGARQPAFDTALVALGATGLALVLTIGVLEAEAQRQRRLSPLAQLALYLPLLVPPVAFLFGLVQLQIQLGFGANRTVVTLGHALFVLPYVFLTLAESYRRLDPRWAQAAATLGSSPFQVFWQMRLPLLSVPILIAAAVGFAVSVGQYLPTLLLGGGRVATLTTEAVSLASGGDRRLAAAFALLQLLLPALGFALALGLPRLVWQNRRGLLTP